MNFSKKHGAGVECSFKDFVDPRKPENNFGWRPFQIAFILMNLKAIVNPAGKEREIVDLLYFPTGGGKTEAYLGLMAFVIANRRLRSKDTDEYNRDGGVTAILRYTLRLLTTQQRDRITKMVLAAEMIRAREYPKYGKEQSALDSGSAEALPQIPLKSLKKIRKIRKRHGMLGARRTLSISSF